MRNTRARKRSQRAGILAEYVALLLLLCKAYRPLAIRYKTPVGEIDLIVQRGRSIVFVEVKLRPSHHAAAEAVTAKNQARVIRAAQYFLGAHPAYAQHAVRFDVCLVSWYRLPQHIPHAFTDR